MPQGMSMQQFQPQQHHQPQQMAQSFEEEKLPYQGNLKKRDVKAA